jgi:predicted phosphodiesterase
MCSRQVHKRYRFSPKIVHPNINELPRHTHHGNMATNTRSVFDKSNIFAPEVPSVWQRLRRSPTLSIAQWLYTHQPAKSIPKPTAFPVKVVCISDTHNEQPRDLPFGDILIHAGDLTVNGTFKELQVQLDWLSSLPHQHKIVVGGNHDLLLDQTFFSRNPRLVGLANEKQLQELRWGSIIYICRSSATLNVRGRSYRVYGNPMTPQYGNWAFQYPDKEDIWSNTVPEGTDILVTHGPARGHLDSSPSNPSYLHGCAHLQREIWRAKPQLHVCGHIHSARGVEQRSWFWLEWGYDAVCRDDRRVGIVLMLSAWVWSWVLYVLGRERKATMTSVNAAVVGGQGLVEGEKTLIVDLA